MPVSNDALPVVHLVRHGETAWTLSRQHTGLTDLPLTERGEERARAIAERLRGRRFALVLTSPLRRAARTCALAGFEAQAHVEPDLVEWDYGRYEGRTTREIVAERPGWQLFRDGCPDGETAQQVGARADRVIARARAAGGDVLLFSSAHVLCVLGARWVGLDPSDGRCFTLATASSSELGYVHGPTEPVIRLWNVASEPDPRSA
jgi:probable phosphoglycerate mutase